MTDNPTPLGPDFDADAWLTKNEQVFAKLAESIRPENKATLFDALAQAGITSVEVTFDGFGDSGQIEDVIAKTGDTEVALPKNSIELAQAEWGNPEIVRATHPLKEAIEQLAYDFLRETHDGWENNEGAFGDFFFDVAGRTITLNYNERFEDSEYTQHVF
jgi:hypothetical protein